MKDALTLYSVLYSLWLAAPLVFLFWYVVFLTREAGSGMTIQAILLVFARALAWSLVSWMALASFTLALYPLLLHQVLKP